MAGALFAGQFGCGGISEKIVVVGAGMAGLGAASSLKALGHEVVLLEARSRVGGRIYSTDLGDSRVELGASWIHGIQGNPLYAMAQRLGLETVATDYDSESAFDVDGVEFSDAQWARVEGWMERFYERAALEPDGSLQRLLEKFDGELGLSGPMRRFFWLAARIFVEIPEAVDAWEVAAGMANWESAFPGANEIVSGGLGQLAESLSEGLKIRFDTFVSEIHYDGKGVVLRAAPAESLVPNLACGGCHGSGAQPPVYENVIRADRVVVTLPLGVLKTGMVRFQPELPRSKRIAIERLGVGTMNKVILRFHETFWPRETSFFALAKEESSQAMELWNMEPDGVEKTLVAFMVGDQARNANVWNDQKAVELVMGDLRTMFGGGIPAPAAFVRSGWHTDLFALGSYPHVPPGASLSECDILAMPVGDRVFFAGDATDSEYMGTAHGAYLSGVRAAEEIRAVIG